MHQCLHRCLFGQQVAGTQSVLHMQCPVGHMQQPFVVTALLCHKQAAAAVHSLFVCLCNPAVGVELHSWLQPADRAHSKRSEQMNHAKSARKHPTTLFMACLTHKVRLQATAALVGHCCCQPHLLLIALLCRLLVSASSISLQIVSHAPGGVSL